MTSCSTSECGIGGWGGPLPGDPDNNSVLTATPAFGGIDVSWTYPATNPQAVAYVQLYRGLSSTFANAILLATVGGNFFYDKSTNTQLIEYFYWIKIVSVNGTVGELIGPASAIAKPPIATVIEQLTGRIDAGLLAQSLKTDIDQITLNYQDLLDEVDNRIAANTALSTALLQVQGGVTEALTFINEEITERQEGDSALVSELNTVAAANSLNLALIQEEQVARVSGDSANAALYTTLNSQVNNTTTGLPATRATLLNDYFTKADTNSAISSATSSLVSTTALNTALEDYTNTAALQTDYYTKTQADSAISSATQNLVSNTGLTNALGSYTTTASLETNYYTKTATDSAISSAVTTSQTTLNGNIASAQTTLQTNINTVDDTVTQIGALYTAKVSVNGLIGGFGVYNDGSTIQAGFDVDEFWVGRTQANKRKPFIISEGVTYIDEAAIEKLTFSKLRDESGSFIVENGKVKADYLNVIRITGGAYTGYAWPPAGQQGFYLGPGGLLLGNANNGRYVQITENGDFYTPGFSVVNGNATFSGSVSGASGTFSGSLTASAINAVNTINIAGNAVTVPVSAFTAGEFRNSEFETWQDAQTIVITTSGNRVYIASSANSLVGAGELHDSGTVAFVTTYRLVRDSTVLMQSSSPSMSYSETSGAGTYTYRFQCMVTNPSSAQIVYFYGGASNRSLFVIETKR
jgi:hypothetical protein